MLQILMSRLEKRAAAVPSTILAALKAAIGRVGANASRGAAGTGGKIVSGLKGGVRDVVSDVGRLRTGAVNRLNQVGMPKPTVVPTAAPAAQVAEAPTTGQLAKRTRKPRTSRAKRPASDVAPPAPTPTVAPAPTPTVAPAPAATTPIPDSAPVTRQLATKTTIGNAKGMGANAQVQSAKVVPGPFPANQGGTNLNPLGGVPPKPAAAGPTVTQQFGDALGRAAKWYEKAPTYAKIGIPAAAVGLPLAAGYVGGRATSS